MKQAMLLLAILISLSGFSKSVPPIVSNALHHEFPTATKISWNKYMDSTKAPVYEADFYVKHQHKVMIFSMIGSPLELEEYIQYEELPDTIQRQIFPTEFIYGMKAYNYELNNTYYLVNYRYDKHRYTDKFFDQEGNVTEQHSYKSDMRIGYLLMTIVIAAFISLFI